jgi:creatinine amidohydrolase
MQLGERNWTEVEELTGRVVVLPLGSFEQHGHHLPLLTDTMIGGEIVRRSEAELGDTALFLPMLWVGASEHHLAFAGTVTVSNKVYVQMLTDILESLISAGFQRIFLLNAHGGNRVPGQMAIYDVQTRHRDKPDLWLAFGSWFSMAAERLASLDQMQQQNVIHACEWETSVILSLRPELVKREAIRGATIPFESAFYYPDYSRPSRVDVPRAFEQLSATGAIGYPEMATPEKGEEVLAAAVDEVVAFVREFASWPTLNPQ